MDLTAAIMGSVELDSELKFIMWRAFFYFLASGSLTGDFYRFSIGFSLAFILEDWPSRTSADTPFTCSDILFAALRLSFFR